MLIHVTEDDIRGGCKRNPSFNPIARAIYRETGKEVRVIIGRYVEYEGNRFSLPTSVVTFIYNFDYGLIVFPFSFELPKFNFINAMKCLLGW